MITLHCGDRDLLLDVDDNSYRYRRLKGEHILVLNYALDEYIDIPLGAWCMFQGQKYTLENPKNFVKNGEENFEFTLILESPQARLSKYKIRNPVDKRLKFPYTATPREHLAIIAEILNEKEGGGWTIGKCIDDLPKAINYNHTSLDNALSMLSDEFDTEYEINNREISLWKVEYNKDNPLLLSYGKGKGVLPGLGRQNLDETKPLDILYVQGGERNIDFSKYGSRELLLPKNQTLEYEGRTYMSSEDGLSISRLNKEVSNGNEGSIDCSHIYPSRIGKVSAVDFVDPSKNFYDFYDNSIPINLNYNNYLITGETMVVRFESGMLAGKEFDVKYIHDERRFEIVPTEIDGQTMPNESYKPQSGGLGYDGDSYAIFGCMLPNEYICDNSSKTGASWDMFRTAAKHLFSNEDPRYTFILDLDGITVKKKWLEMGGKIFPGSYVRLTDIDFLPEGTLIRQIAVKDFVNNVESPTLELSNVAIAGSIHNDLSKIDSNEVLEESRHKYALNFAARRWRDLKEMSDMLEKAIGGFSAQINPIAISTMHIKVGSEQLQFQFVTSKTQPREIIPNFVINNATMVFSVSFAVTTYLQHMTLGINSLSTSHTPEEYKFWNMRNYTSPYLGNDKSPYYLYARCSKSSDVGEFILEKDPFEMDNPDGNYYFLVGVLSSEWENARSFETCYGFTEILPGRMTINLIKSVNGFTYFNLAEGEIGGNIRIKSGSGYNNLSDKPNLGIYATYVDFGVLSDRIYANVTQINNIWEKSAGWITRAEGNLLYAYQEDLTNGQKLISYINQTAGSTTIYSSRINLVGAVSFNSLNSSLQTTINGKVGRSDLGDLAFKSKVEQAMKDETLIVGGYIKTSLIRVDEIFANAATIGSFKISYGRLEWRDLGDGANVTLGYNFGYGRNNCISVKAGFFGNGIAAINSTGGAAIFASAYDSPVYPGGSYLYAIYVDGDIVVTRGNIIVSSGGRSGKGVVQADQILPQNGFSGSMKGKSQEFVNGILVRAW